MDPVMITSFLATLQEIRDELKKPLPPLPPIIPLWTFLQQQSTQQEPQPLEVPQSWYEYSNSPTPQEAQKEVEQVKRQPLHQATVEDDTESTTESTTKHGSSIAVNKSMLPTIPRLCATRSSGDSAACLSMAYSACAAFLAWHGLLPGYIECTEGMEATGQG